MASRVYKPRTETESSMHDSMEDQSSYTLNTADDREGLSEDEESTVSGLSVPTTVNSVSDHPEEQILTADEQEVSAARPFPDTKQKMSKAQIIAVNTNLTLQELIEGKKWDQAISLLTSDAPGVAKAEDVVSIPFNNCGGDYPLHVVCDWDYEPDINDGTSLYSCRGTSNSHNGGDDKSVVTGFTTRTRLPKNKPDFLNKPPPFELIKIILDAYPKAARTRGRDGSLPLHYASRGCAPPPIMKMLIKAFPQALDVADAFNETPRAFYQKHAENIAFLDRPICCWEHHFRDVEERDSVEEEIATLSEEVSRLELELEEEKEFMIKATERLLFFEQKANEFSSGEEGAVHGRHVEQKAVVMEKQVGSELKNLSKKLDDLKEALIRKYEAPSLERKYIRLFDEDVISIYREASLTLNLLKQENVQFLRIDDVASSSTAYSNTE